ncbi:MAG: ABC transporter permease subunit [Panacagrimonas sp.]
MALLRLRLRYLARPAATAGLIVFLLAFADFAVPDFFWVPTYTSEIFAQVSGYLDPAAAAAMTLPVMLATAGLLALLIFSARRVERSLGKSAPQPVFSRHRPTIWTLTSGLIATGLAAILSGLPLFWMISRTGSFDQLLRAFHATRGDLADSLALSAVVALLAVAVAQVPAYVMARSRQHLDASIRLVFAILLAVPASLLGLALIALGNRPGLPGLAYDAGVVLVVAVTVKWLPILAEILRRAWQTVGRDQEEAALAHGVSWWRAVLRTGAITIAPATMVGVLLMFVLAFNELTLVSLLAPPGISTLPLRIFQTVHYGPESLLAAICLIQVLAVGVAALTGLLLARRLR